MSIDLSSGVLLSAAVVAGTLALAIAAFIYTSRRGPRMFTFTRSFGRRATQPPADVLFIGRERELEQFRKLIVDPGAAAPARARRLIPFGRRRAPPKAVPRRNSADLPPSLVLVTGAPGIGKHALLERCERLCGDERQPPRCSPVIELREARRVDELLEEIVGPFVEGSEERFRGFEAALEQYRRVSSGQKTRGQEGLEAARDVAATVGAVVPGADRGATLVASPAADRLVQWWEGAADLTAVGDAFAADLLAAANEDPHQRLVVIFSDLDSRPNDREVIWLRNWLLPRMTTTPAVLVVASVVDGDADAAGVAGLDRLGSRQSMHLEPFTDAEARRFVAEVIGIVDNAPLADAIVTRSEGILDRLHGYRRFVGRFPEVRASNALPDEADAWASGGLTYVRLHELPSRYLEQLVVASSPLRWFNAALLAAVAEEAKLERADDDPSSAADLVRPGTRPAWITARGGGWAHDDPERRRALVADFRRLDPRSYRRTHRLAASYHRDRLASWDLEDELPEDRRASVDIFEPVDAAPERYNDPEYVAVLAELSYHLLALAPDRAFPIVVRKAVEALFSTPQAAQQIIPLDSELGIRPNQRLYLDLLARAAVALRDRRHAEAIRILDQLKRAGEPVALVKPVVLHLLGESYWNLDDDVEGMTAACESADTAFKELADDPEAGRMRCWNTTWLAFGLARRDGVERAATAKLDEVVPLAERIENRSLLAELDRVRGMIQAQVGDAVAAEASYRAALHRFQLAGQPDEVAGVRLNLGDLFRDEGEYARADRELEIAGGLYAYLADFKNRADVFVSRAAVELLRSDPDPAKAEAHIEEARRLRPRDPFLENSIGNAFFSAGEYESAVARYDDALSYAPDLPFVSRNRANALFRQWQYDDDVAKLREAEEVFTQLRETYGDTTTLELLTQLKRATNQDEDADVLFNELKNRRLRDLERHPQRAGAYWALGDLLQNHAEQASEPEATRLWGEAEQSFRRASELDADEPAYELRRAQCLRALARPAEAVDQLWSSLLKAPNRKAARGELAEAIEALPLNDALRELRRAFDELGTDEAFLTTYAQLVTPEGQAALPEVRRDLERFPEEAEFHYLLATLLRASKPASDVLADRFEPSSPTRGVIASKSDGGGPSPPPELVSHSDEALDELRRACELVHSESQASRRVQRKIDYLLALADLRLERRDWAEARRAALEARNLDPADMRADAILPRIRFANSWPRAVVDPVPYVTPVEVEVSMNLLSWVEPPAAQRMYDEMFPELRDRLQARWGFQFPGVSVRPNESLPDSTVAVYLHEIPRYALDLLPVWLAGAKPEDLGSARPSAFAAQCPWDGTEAAWIPEAALSDLPPGIPVWDPRGVLVATIGAILDRHAGEFVTVRDVARRVAEDPELSAQSDLDIAKLTTTVRRKAATGVSATDLRDAAGELALGATADEGATNGRPTVVELEGGSSSQGRR